MVLSVPGYLKRAGVLDDAVRYPWDDWKALPGTTEPDEEIAGRLKGLSQRAVLAFGCGSAEWVVYRFEKLCAESGPWDYLVAAWAMTVDVRYGGYGDSTQWQVYSHNGWDGPIRRPIRNALQVLEAALQQLAWNRIDPVRRAGKVAALARYVLTDPAPYIRWCDDVIERFNLLYPRHPEDPLGDVVPRQAIDPEFDFKLEQTEALVNQFLAGLDYRSNVFLSPPEGMLQHFDDGEDFVGTPYIFDIELDRRARRVTTRDRTGPANER
jgi:hypothetical protein